MHLPIRRYFALLTTYLKPQWIRTSLMILCLLTGIGLQLLNPQIVSYFIDTLTAHGPTSVLVTAGGIYILAAILNQGTAVVGAYFSQYVSWTATNQLRSDLVRHCLALDMGFHKAHTSGEMIERIDGDVDALSNFFSQFAVNLMSNLLLLLAMLVLFFTISWLVGVVLTAFAMFALFMLSYLNKRSIPLWKEQRRMSASYYGFLGERLTSLEDIRANGAEQAVMRDYYRILRTWLPINNLTLRTSALMGITMLFLFVCGTALALGLGLYLWSLKAISLGTVYVMFAYTNALSQPLGVIQNEMQDLQQAEACMQRIETLLHLSSALPDTGSSPLPNEPLSVELRDIAFGYEEHEPVLHGLSVKIAPGKALGLLGRTGSGKTTVARLLFRLYDPQAGEIYANNTPLREISLYELRRHIGMVTQEVHIFHASVRDNLTFFERSILDEHIIALLNELGLRAWYRSLPHGLDTLLGNSEGERGLSAGEAQLLACARVFLADPGIVILDEASSRLDPATETLIEQAIARLLTGRTALIIAHKLSTLQHVDDILIIEQGNVLEYGSRITLANDPTSHFASLLRSDLLEVLA